MAIAAGVATLSCAAPESTATNVPEVTIEPQAAEPPPLAQRPTAAPTAASTTSAATDARDLASARALFRQGVMAYSKGDYATARGHFESAYGLAPAPGLLFNLARAAQKQGDQRAACKYFRKWVATASPARKASVRASFAQCK